MVKKINKDLVIFILLCVIYVLASILFDIRDIRPVQVEIEEALTMCDGKDCFRKLVVTDNICLYDENTKEKCVKVDTYYVVKGLED